MQEQLPSAELVNGEDGDKGGEEVDQASDNSRHEGSIVSESDGLKEHRSVEHDNVDTSELLEKWDEDGHGKLRAVLALDNVRPGVLHHLRLVAGGNQVIELFVNIVSATNATEHLLGCLRVTTLDEGVRGLGEEERPDRDDSCRNGGKGETDTPSPAAINLCGAIIDEVGGKDADRDHELESDVEHSTEARRCHLRKV